jgi:hypothetical protein
LIPKPEATNQHHNNSKIKKKKKRGLQRDEDTTGTTTIWLWWCSFLARLGGSETLPTSGLASEKHELKVHIQVQWK